MDPKKAVLLVVNPISGGIDKEELINYLQTRFEQEKRILSIYHTSGIDDKERLTETLDQLKPERILIAGGDGTVKLIAEVVKNSSIPLGLFPSGSANGLAENLELPDEYEDLIEVALGNHFLELDVLNINNELCLHLSDIGLNAELIRNYEEGEIRGKLGYFLHSIPTLINSEFPFHFRFTIKGEEIRREGFLLGIANAKKYGTGATINPHGKLNDGKFEILVFKKFDIPEILKTFQRNVTLNKEFLEIFPATHAVIHSEEKLPFQVDGEYRGEVQKIEAYIAPHKIKIAVPKELIQSSSRNN